MARNKITKDIVPDDFTLSLVIVDAIPVVFFTLSMIIVGMIFKSSLFICGASLCLFAGAAKVIWKLIVVLHKRNIWVLFIQMRILMPVGFLMMAVSLIVRTKGELFSNILSVVLTWPTFIYFAAGLAGMILMTIFAFVLDSSNVKANWTEQITNGIAQFLFFIGFLITYIKL